MTLDEHLAALDLVAIPIWVHDYEHCRIAWGNQAALEMWRAESREALRQRDVSNLSESMRARVDRMMSEVRAGRTVEEQITMYPRGTPATAMVHISGIDLEDGRLALLMQCVLMEKAPDPELLRSIEALRHTTAMVVLLNERGELLLQNPAVIRAVGELPFSEWFADAAVSRSFLRVITTGEVLRMETTVRTLAGERWYSFEVHRTTDPSTGALAVLVHAVDETVRHGAERTAATQADLIEEQRRMLDLVERQRREIVSLYAPILDIGPGALVVPIIGSLSQERSADLTERLLHAIVARRARRVVLDMTGAADLDATSISHLMKLASAIGLLGARSIMTGIQPSLAQVIQRFGATFSGVEIRRSLSDGILLCLAE